VNREQGTPRAKIEFRPLPWEPADGQTRLGQVVSEAELISRRGGWKRNGQVVVCAHGWFDLLHPGHIRLLEQARSLGDVLVVAVAAGIAPAVRSDARADEAPVSPSEITRPVTPAAERAEILAALACVDCVIELDGSLEYILGTLAPDILVEGSAQAEALHPPTTRPLGATTYKLVRIPLEPGYSTTGLIEKITGRVIERTARPSTREQQ